MLEILAHIDETVIPNALIALGALMLMLSLVERRIAAVVGGLFLLLGAGISLAPSPVPSRDRSPPLISSPADRAPTRSGVGISPRAPLVRSGEPEDSGGAGAERDPTGCTAKFTDLKLNLAAASDGEVADVLYQGFLASLMPSAELLPCATRHFVSKPLAPRAVATSGGRAEAEALRVLVSGGVAGLERTYGSECSRVPSKDEVPLARIRLLRFNSVAAGAAWDALPWEATAEALHVTEAQPGRAGWFRGSCGKAPAAIFWQETRVGNVAIEISVYAAPESFADGSLEAYAEVLTQEIVRRMPPEH